MSERITPFGLQPEQNVLKEKLLTLCPEIFQDGKLNIEALQSLLPDEVEGEDAERSPDQKEHFGLSWPGKNRARQLALKKPVGSTLIPCPGEGVNEDTTQNIFIEGDNLEVLKLLREAYADQVKMIYIDPPYNTGNDFVYKDDFSDSLEDYLQKTGQKEGKTLLVANPKASGRFHTNWLNFIYPRLRLARELLVDEGLIFVSIDDNEVHNLRQVMNELFGEENLIGVLVWKRRQNVDSRAKRGISVDHEYVLCYTNDSMGTVRGQDKDMTKYSNPDNDPKGDWMSDNMVGLATKDQRPNLHYDLTNPKTGITYSCPPTGWRYEPKRMKELMERDEVLFPANPNGRPRRKKFKIDLESDFTGFSTILNAAFNTQATRELRALFNDKEYFDFPKPTDLIRQLILQATEPDKQHTVLDFFAGSATTAHAVLDVNKEDGGNRRFICVQLPEKNLEDGEAFKAGYKTLADISKDRIRRVFKAITEEGQQLEIKLASLTTQLEQAQAGYTEEVEKHSDGKMFGDQKLPKSVQKVVERIEKLSEEIQKTEQTIRNVEKLDLGFKAYELESSCFATYKPYSGSNTAQLTLSFQQQTDKPLVDGWAKPDLITELMLLEGFPLHSRQEVQPQYSENEVFAVTSDFNENTLYVCLDAQLQEETVEALNIGNDDIFVCLDSSLTDVQKVRLDDKLKLKTV